MPKSRQQRRARARSPMGKRRRGATAFLSFMLLVLLGGSALIVLFRANPPPLTRGVTVGEHWHAKYTIYICGKQLSNFPAPPGEFPLATHNDAFIHLHPQNETEAGDLANLGTFLRTYETSLFEGPDGKRALTFPDGTSYKDGDRCPKDKKRYNIEVTNKSKKIDGAPEAFLPHDGDEIEIRFGPKGKGTAPNPYAESKGLPDPGTGGGATPAPDAGQPPPAPPTVPLPKSVEVETLEPTGRP